MEGFKKLGDFDFEVKMGDNGIAPVMKAVVGLKAELPDSEWQKVQTACQLNQGVFERSISEVYEYLKARKDYLANNGVKDGKLTLLDEPTLRFDPMSETVRFELAGGKAKSDSFRLWKQIAATDENVDRLAREIGAWTSAVGKKTVTPAQRKAIFAAATPVYQAIFEKNPKAPKILWLIGKEEETRPIWEAALGVAAQDGHGTIGVVSADYDLLAELGIPGRNPQEAQLHKDWLGRLEGVRVLVIHGLDTLPSNPGFLKSVWIPILKERVKSGKVTFFTATSPASDWAMACLPNKAYRGQIFDLLSDGLKEIFVSK